jgi:hypothetical protein
MANQYTKSEVNKEAVLKYVAKQGTLDEIALKYQISRKILTRWVTLSGFNIHSKKQLNYNETIFNKIDSEEKAYWLGFIYADGYVSDKNSFEVSLSLKDITHLEKLGKFLNIGVKKDSFRCRIGINNKQLVEALKNHGVVPRKSLVLKFPTHLKTPLINSFVRGYFDGDGCIYYGTKDNTASSMAVSIIGTLNMLQAIEIQSNIKCNYQHDKRHHPDCFSFRINKTIDILKFMEYLYKDSTIHLDRKYKKYCRLKQKCFRLLGSNIGER